MKKILPVITFLFATVWLNAQITVTNTTFPAVGDTLKTATDNSPQGVVITAAGANFTWDYTSLKADNTQEVVFKNANQGSVTVAGAGLFTAPTANTEAYYKVSATRMELLAVKGPDPIGLGQSSLLKFTPPLIERRAPLTFPSINISSSALTIPFSSAIIPDTLIANIPFNFDSIRIKVTTQRNDFVDAFGSLKIPGGTYDVLREKRTEYRETRIEIKLPIIGWFDVTDVLLMNPNLAGIGKDTIVTYNFFSNTEKEPIAVITTDNTGQASEATFKNNGLVSAAGDVSASGSAVLVSPNPFSSEARFELNNFSPGNYSLQIFSSAGVLFLEKQVSINGPHHERLDLSGLPAGSNFYLISGTDGKPLTSGKLLKQ